MGYEQFLYGRIRKMKSILAIKTKDPAHDTSKNLKAKKALLNWLNKMTLVKILDWFDARQLNGLGIELYAPDRSMVEVAEEIMKAVSNIST